MKIANKISLSFLALSIVISIPATSVFYIISRDSVLSEISGKLSIAVESRVNHIETYLQMLKISVSQLSESFVLRDFIISVNGGGQVSAAAGVAAERLGREKHINTAVSEYLLLDNQGMVIASSDEMSLGQDKSADSMFLGGAGGAYVKDVFYCECCEESIMAVSAPIKDVLTGRLLGIIAARVKMKDLNGIVAERTGLGETGEMYIVNKYGYMITPSRFVPDVVLKRRVDTDNSRLAREHEKIEEHDAHKAKALTVSYDYRGRKVMGAHRYIPWMRWTVLAEISYEEAVRPVRLLWGVSMLIIIIVPIVVLAAGSVIARFITSPIEKLRSAVKAVSSGDLSLRVSMDSKDEIGQLSAAFDKMMETLERTTVSKDHLNSIMEGMADCVIVAGSDGNIRAANRSACLLLGYVRGELIGKGIGFLIPERAGDLSAGREIGIMAKDGRVVPVILSATTILGRGGKTETIYAAKDISDFRKSRKEVDALARRLEFIIGVTRTGLDIIDSDFNVSYVDPVWSKIYGDYKGRKCYEYFAGRTTPCPTCGIPKALATRKPVVSEDVLPREGNRPVLVTTIPFQDENGRWLVAEVNADLTERKASDEALSAALQDEKRSRQIVLSMLEDNIEVNEKLRNSIKELGEMQARLAHAAKMETVGRMSAGVAHEVKNPLAIILQGINYFESVLSPEGAEARKTLMMMKDGVRRADNIVRSLLDFSRAPEVKITSEEINSVIRDSIELSRHRLVSGNVQVKLDLADGLPEVRIDKEKIEQVFINLFNNASDAMPGGGELRVRSKMIGSDSPETTAVVVDVEDTGVGMDDGTMDKIFEPFFTTKSRAMGTGLGLAITKSIVELHNGSIEVESHKGKGTRFTITLKAS